MMNLLLIFFALPLATIVFSIALQRILDNPILVASIIFSIFLIVTFVVGDLNLLIATIIYTILSFITAIIVKYIDERNNNEDNENCNNNGNNTNQQNQCRRMR
ncbi:MAG: DUF2651 family protein [Clostridia bacterium]|nr:DUF2651 family protein [Clostridia bacterium]